MGLILFQAPRDGVLVSEGGLIERGASLKSHIFDEIHSKFPNSLVQELKQNKKMVLCPHFTNATSFIR